ncbi:MAG: sortase [Anaerolineales bacterium]|nr:sortase [Anaerolineales bacterium]
MNSRRKTADDMSIPELEALLARKKQEARRARLLRFQRSGRIVASETTNLEDPSHTSKSREQSQTSQPKKRKIDRTGFQVGGLAKRVLLLLEISAALGFIFIVLSGFQVLRGLNRETAELLAGPTPAPTPLIRAVVLPSGHTPPTSPGGARFNEEEIPRHLRPIAQSYASIPIPTPGPEQARSISIPALWDFPAPVVQGDGWEQLKKGVAQHIGSANPGEVGNMVLSAHNDIYGELFRDLDRLKPGDEIRIFTATNEYLYRVTGTRIVEPTEVSVMDPTARPTVTLISCYPYLVDTLRIVVFGELSNM